MQDALALLSAALDGGGYICIRGFGVGPNKGDKSFRRQKIFAPGQYQQAVDFAAKIDGQGIDTYYTTSTLLGTANAEAANVHAVKLFKVDLDIGANDPKKYTNKKEAVTSLLAWCKTHGIPDINAIVDSGTGAHCYWIIDEALGPDEGREYSEKIKALLLHAGVKFDQGITGDIARVLRIPGTLNRKNPAVARRVKLMMLNPLLPTDPFLDAVDALWAKTPNMPLVVTANVAATLGLGNIPAHLRGKSLDDSTKSFFDFRPKKFSIILQKSNSTDDKGKLRGCAQVQRMVSKQKSMTEPEWRAILSIAHFCDDGETAIHDVSNQHGGYAYDATVAKAEQIKGPYLCSTFESNWGADCKDCPQRGKINSPILLGDYVPIDTAPEATVVAQSKAVDDQPVAYTIPEYPRGYLRSKDGGVYRRNPEDENNPIEISKYPLYVVDRLKSEEDGYMVQLRYHAPMDGVLDELVECTAMASQDGFAKVLARIGIPKYEGEAKAVRNYIKAWMQDLEMKRTVSMVKTQMGWTPNFASFVVGDRELTAYGSKYSQSAPSMARTTLALDKSGNLEDWRKTFAIYADPRFVAYTYCAAVGFGAPLMKLLDLDGLLINAYSEKSGTGKSTTLEAATSIWGHPKSLILTCGKDSGDTLNSRFHRMGQYNNLPICVDEATKMTPDEMSAFLLSVTSGRGRHRMQASSNAERANNATWASICLSSANTSFIDALQVDKVGVQGELMRILEVHLPPNDFLSKEEADEIFVRFKHHYGLAGQVYIQHVMQVGLDVVKTRLELERKNLDRLTKAEKHERYWSAANACIIVGLQLAKDAGLHDIDIDTIREFAVKLIIDTRARHHYTGAAQQRSDLLGEFINMNIASTLVVQVQNVNGKEVYAALKEVSRDLCIRYERNLGKMYVSQSSFNRFMRDKNANIETYLAELEKAGTYVRADTQMRLTKGTLVNSNAVRVYEFNMKDDELPPLI